MALQQTSDDIRDRYDITDHYKAEIASHILELQPPTDCEGTTGLDALVVVLRRIYSASMLGPTGLAKKDWYQKCEQENPIIKHAWHVMGDSMEERAAAGKARADLISLLSSQMNAGVASFKELCTSSLMNRTIWSQLDFCILWPILRSPSMEIVHQDPNVRATESLVILDREQFPGKTLQEAINGIFGVREEGSGHLIYRPNRPFIIRVLLRTKGNCKENRVEFNDIRHFLLPQWGQEINDQGERLFESDPQPYTIIAVVKMRSDPAVVAEAFPDQSPGPEVMADAVRIYSFNGPNIIPTYEDVTLMSPYWSVGDLREHSLEYMLFYMRRPGQLRDDLSGVPEHAPARSMNFEAWKLIGEALDPQLAELKEHDESPADGGRQAEVQDVGEVVPQSSQPRIPTGPKAMMARQQTAGQSLKRQRGPQLPSQEQMFKKRNL
ncbi:hypothetical protein BFJ68_g206 [Fusarium oxysporum]|uniref:Uncharacterized protein n=2 Tax=Fusarium oxysporum TaxID=5507 RepID=A0A420QA82_FUSOX|nr:hypothetical protein BFJ65_g11222 [Fusarium oxysporum f. sp. cepae]RKK56121.1 hypothetical protein BFJ66_g3739 [Fusarium oxysporum f. sp. cepae]RKK59998.1 hypothetical protein BFJ67_g2332 [Fusarium oxysporum f. sp. cepae]RKL01729.1 hypothetical protein BFJ71_g5058 [Fusarium oxysporum]RKL25571.1 hypothetical protein BFJ68_g206 [Fusarium oxysporum]